MSYFECAARDPIFWLHHANIDRLWQVWLNQLGGRKNPIANAPWKDQKFSFFDENKKQVTLSACKVLKMTTQLGYQYPGVPVNNVDLCPAVAVPVGPGTFSNVSPVAPKILAATTATETRLGNTPVQVKVDLPPEAGQRMKSFATTPPKRGHLRLAVEGIKVLHPGAVYQVYLNLPAGTKADPAGPYFLGNISLFTDPAHSEGITRTFDLSSRARTLGAKREVQLTFLRERLDQPNAGVAAAPNEPAEFLRFTRVAILER
jgi:tyrosinase